MLGLRIMISILLEIPRHLVWVLNTHSCNVIGRADGGSYLLVCKFSNLLYCPYVQSELVDVTRMINFKPLVQLLFVLSHWVQAITLYSLRMQFNTLPIK